MNRKATVKATQTGLTPGRNSIPQRGQGRFSILNRLRTATRSDLNFTDGSILGSMCTRPPSIALQAFKHYHDVNLGDPGLFPGTLELEQQAISMLGELLQGPESCGVYVTGGTEANILAVKTALLKYLSRFKSDEIPDRRKLKLIVPQSAHFSFDKAAELTGVQLVKLPLDREFRMDLQALKNEADEHCFAIVAVAGTTAYGAIDPINEISELARERGIYLHVDAAFGGFVIPFMNEDFRKNHPFDFSLPGVCSITIDPHKMGRGVTPGGAILYRDRETAESTSTRVTYLAGGETRHLTLVGTRSGAAVLACYASMLHHGREGYRQNVTSCLKVTELLCNQIEKMKGYSLVTRPLINVVGIVPRFCTPAELGNRLRDRGIAVSVFDQAIRVVMMPHVTPGKIKRLCRILKEIENA